MSTKPAVPAKPLPAMQGYTETFYSWCRKHELRFQRCTGCGTFRHPPRPLCAQCFSFESEWAPVSGKGTVHTWTTVRKALHPAFAGSEPYAASIVTLDEGPSLATWVTDIAPEALQPGLRVGVWFDDISEQVALPKFRPL